MQALRFGEITVERCVEAEGPSFYPGFIFPDFDAQAFEAERHWLESWSLDAKTGRLLMSLHSYVIKTRHHTILVDTCVGNDKHRPDTRSWHMRDGRFLADLAALGVAPEAVDFVLCTHLHVDHVGWNTRLEDGRWVPTFPNATYLFHRLEYDYWERHEMEDDIGSGMTRHESFADSVLPVMEAGQAALVEGDHTIDDSLRLEPSPGHSPGHVFLNLESKNGSAIFTGDVMHHPLQIAFPEWSSRYCYDPAQSRLTREAVIERCTDTSILVLAAHFPQPVAGRIFSTEERGRFAPFNDSARAFGNRSPDIP